MGLHPTFILTGMAAGAIAAGIVLAPSAVTSTSAAPSAQTCHDAGPSATVCQAPGDWRGDFAPQIQQAAVSAYPFGWLEAL